MRFISSCFVFWANVKGIEDVASRVNVQPIKFDGYKKNFKFLIKCFRTKNVIYLFHFFVANNRMNLIVLNKNHLHANGHLNLPWFFIFVWLFIFVGNQMWLGAIKIESQSCINNFLCQNKSIVDIENGFTQTTLRFTLSTICQEVSILWKISREIY